MIENIEKDVISIVSEVSEVDEGDISPNTNLVQDLGINSIKAIEIVVAIEKKYKISIRDEDVPKIIIVKQIVDLTEELISKKSVPA